MAQPAGAAPMPASSTQQQQRLPGYERDLNELIDALALQAHDAQWLSFPLFKQLWSRGCYAYIHQAYWGCEHSPEYVQLLFAAVLDRLDVPSPTAPSHSRLWQLHHLEPLTASSMPQQPGQQQLKEAPFLALPAPAAAAGEPMDVDAAEPAPQPPPLQQQQQHFHAHAQDHRQQPQQHPQPPAGAMQPPPPRPMPALGGLPQHPQQLAQQPGMPPTSPLTWGDADPLAMIPSPMPSPLPQRGMHPPLDAFTLPSPAVPVPTQHAVHQQQHQRQLKQQQGLTPEDWQLLHEHAAEEEEEGFLADLLAILEEGDRAADAGPGPTTPAWRGQPHHEQQLQLVLVGPQQQQQQQHMTLAIPVWVKGAAVFVLLALHEAQLNLPKVPVYLPLPLLHRLAGAATELAALGPAGADALQALHTLVSQQRLLVGQFRRPSAWEPQLPPWLTPHGRMPRNVGLNTAIGAAARKAARASPASAMHAAAVAAAARAARGAAGFDPQVHREALFHIKTALRSLSNFTSLQQLCDGYVSARRAVFEPLLPAGSAPAQLAAPAPRAAAAAAAISREQEQEQRAESEQGGARSTSPEALVVQRGGSRYRRKVAIQSSAATAAAAAGSRRSASEQQAPGVAPLHQQQQQQRGPARNGPPELFDGGFASQLQALANDQASRMMLLLDPYYEATKVRQREIEQQRATRAAEEAAAAVHREKLARFKSLTMRRTSSAPGTSAAAAAAAAAAGATGPARLPPAGGARSARAELLAAGIFTPEQLQSVPLAGDVDATALGGVGGLQQALRRDAQRRRDAVRVAEGWLLAQDVLMEADEDMP